MPQNTSAKLFLIDRLALFVGCGLLGALTGLVLVFPIGYLLGALFQPHEAPFPFEVIPIGTGLAIAALGAIRPDQTVDALGKVWHGILMFFRALIGFN